MELKEIINKDEWEGFLLQCTEKTFLQSWNWGEFNIKTDSQIWRLGVYNQGRPMAVALVYKISAKRGTFLFIPHGPVITPNLTGQDKKEILELILVYLKDVAMREKASFIRLASVFTDNEENRNIFLDLGFESSPIHMHPEVTWELDITPSEEELLKNMRKTTRYLIRQAEKNPDVTITISDKIDDLRVFWPVYLATAKRHHFVVFSEKYLQEEFNSFIKDKQILIFLGSYKSKVVSAAIFVFWQNMCFYHQSGSLINFNKIPVSYLLQWHAIKEAKSRGCITYNFWGIAPDINIESDAQKSKHPWAGLSLFKMGFGGNIKKYVPTQDFIISKKYWINYVVERIRKFKRGL